jgi:hypothetical protein
MRPRGPSCRLRHAVFPHRSRYTLNVYSLVGDKVRQWEEFPGGLKDRRWYALNQVLPDGRALILGGRQAYMYEFFPNDKPPTSYYMRFLRKTTDRYGDKNNLYPFQHLSPDGNLFIFANRRSILFDYKRNQILKELPLIPSAFKRNYPSTGSSVLLPLRLNIFFILTIMNT